MNIVWTRTHILEMFPPVNKNYLYFNFFVFVFQVVAYLQM